MADSEDLTLERIVNTLVRQYIVLVSACAMLPIPITLPKQGNGTFASAETVPAVRRLVEIAGEQPMPEENQADLFTAALFWLTAADMVELLIAIGWNEIRAFQALAALGVSGDALADLGIWILTQEKD
ncbi:hypothetical protein ACIQMP_07775 [Streptomyces sp. NPDC091385]|uniref:hypothetical protein n=1 Tax=Streptomyces sp. NPDC091385 TaxID=3365997 RepID=UPI00380E0082